MNRLVTLTIRHPKTSGYHPRTNGLTERFEQLQNYYHYVSSNKKDWDIILRLLLFAYRTSTLASTNEIPFIYYMDAIQIVQKNFLMFLEIEGDSIARQHFIRFI